MPDRCCVTACKSNYDSTNEKVSVFRFPKDPKLRKKWIRQIPRKNWTPNERTVVCEKHFSEDCIVRDHKLSANGSVFTMRRARLKLKEGSIPTVFPGCPEYLSKDDTTAPDSDEEELMKIEETAMKDFLKNDQISSWEEVKLKFAEKIPDLPKDTLVLHFTTHIFVLFMCFEGCPSVKNCIKIMQNFTVEVYVNGSALEEEEYIHLLSNQRTITLWSEVEKLIRLMNTTTNQMPKKTTYESPLEYLKLYIAD